MFQVGKSLKVKVEISPDMIGFGRATIIETQKNRLFLHIKTDKKSKYGLPKGSHIWFVSEQDNLPFKGWWTTTVQSTKTIQNKQTVECTRPIFESIRQRRKSARAIYKCPVLIPGKKWEHLPSFSSHNISTSGIKIESSGDCAKEFEIQNKINLLIKSRFGDIKVSANVIQARYNWLANKTSVGLEFIAPSKKAAALLEQLLEFLDNTLAINSDKNKSKQNSLSQWLKTKVKGKSIRRPKVKRETL